MATAGSFISFYAGCKPGVLGRKCLPVGSRGEATAGYLGMKSPEAEAVYRHCLQVLSAETINIHNSVISWFLVGLFHAGDSSYKRHCAGAWPLSTATTGYVTQWYALCRSRAESLCIISWNVNSKRGHQLNPRGVAKARERRSIRPVSNWKLSGPDRSTSQIDRSECSSWVVHGWQGVI